MEYSRLMTAFHCIMLLWCIIWYFYVQSKCIIVDLERPATLNITGQSSDGAEIWGYVEVRKGAHLFWRYYKSPHRVSLSSPERPWPIIFYAVPNASSGHGTFNRIGPLEPRNSTWLHNTDLLVVETPATSGIINRVRMFLAQTTTVSLHQAEDILVLLRALAMEEIATLQSSPLVLLNSTYGGNYAGRISNIVRQTILVGDLVYRHSAVGGLVVESCDGILTPQQQIINTRPRICVAVPADEMRTELFCTCSLQYVLCTYFR